MPAAIPILIGASVASAGVGAYTGIKQSKQQKEYSKKQEATQKKLKAEQQAKRKKKIDLMRRELLAPSAFGGRRSLTSGGEMGIPQGQQKEVLG